MPLLSTQGQNTGYTHYIKFTYEDLQRRSWADTFTSSTDVSKKIAFAKKGSVITCVTCLRTVATSGPPASALLTCGPDQTSDLFLTSHNIATSTVLCNTGSQLSDNLYVFGSDSDIWIRVQGSDTTRLTSGEWIIAIKILDINDITN